MIGINFLLIFIKKINLSPCQNSVLMIQLSNNRLLSKEIYNMIKNKSTLILLSILLVSLIILVILASAVITNVIRPAFQQNSQWIEIPLYENMPLSQAKNMLDALGVPYEIKSTDSKIANRVEKFEHTGKLEDGKNLIQANQKVTLYSNEKGIDEVLYLTFDDGPTRDNTYEILDKLQNYGIKASFFVEGADVDRYPERMETTFARGHVIACHSYSHQLDVIYSSTDEFIKEVRQYEQAMIDAIGEENFASIKKIIRFPGGTNNAKLNKTKSLEYIAKVREIGYSVYDWTVLTGDAEGASDAATFISNLSAGLERAKNNKLHLIVLMHDKWSTNEALNDILSYLVSEGYYFDTIDNCPEYTFVEN